ncbi:MAG: hypothetical protein LQ343_001202 [Gyalolechia ehrenbergii]|nr:MAG: hypothetical protein LQ343_001202 [Gyalolechia ehrenbergii]
MFTALRKYTDICHEQPKPASIPIFDFEHVRPASRASRRNPWIAESRSLASRASRRASSTTLRSTSRRPTIGAPSEFRRVEFPHARTPGFRPLQLSIYLPGNQLPTLPTFREEEGEEDNAGLTYPPQALVKSRSDSMLSRPSTAFSIPRKPVPNRTSSMEQSRCSMESRYTLNETNVRPESRSVHHRPRMAASQSTRDFLDAIDARLPQAPPALRSKSGPERVYTLYRKASEQSLRLKTHLEERSQLERSLPEFDVIPEERRMDAGSKSKGLSPILDRDEIAHVDELLGNQRPYHIRSSSLPSRASSQLHPRSSLSGEAPTAPKSFQRSVVSHWLLRTVGSQASLKSDAESLAHSNIEGCTGHQTCTFRDRSSTASSSSTAADIISPVTTPYSSPHKKNDSVSTYHTVSIPRISNDWEKKPVIVDIKPKPVGTAF